MTEYFEAMYAASPDPWDFAHRWYDRRKYALTVAALPRARYRSGYEPGCSIGVLSESLAGRCDALLCTDMIDAAVQSARTRLADRPHVRVERMALPEWPDGTFDLIVVSEVLYYLSAPALTDLLARVRDSLEPGGNLVATHWRHPVAEHVLTGDEVHRALADLDGLAVTAGYRDPDFALDVFTRVPPDARSVAEVEGLWP